MNAFERAVNVFDHWQQRHKVPSFIVAVLKKFDDDHANHLVAMLVYYALIATFPLLLALTAIVDEILQNNPDLRQDILHSAFSELPLVGSQIHEQVGAHSQVGIEAVHGDVSLALIIGILGAIFGGRGVAHVLQHTMNTVWAVPEVDRSGFPWSYLRTFALLAVFGLGGVLAAVAAIVVATIAGPHPPGGLAGTGLRIFGIFVSTLFDIGLFLLAFRLATSRKIHTRDLLLGAIAAAVAWEVLLVIGGFVVALLLQHAHALFGLFGLVLGLIWWFFLQALVTILAVEAEIVRSRRFWPRSILGEPLTEADKAYLHSVADLQVRHRTQRIAHEFAPEADPPARDE